MQRSIKPLMESEITRKQFFVLLGSGFLTLCGLGALLPATSNSLKNYRLASSSTLPVNQGGTGATSLTGLVVGNGTTPMTTVSAPSSTVVGITDTQIVTNKDLSAATNIFPTFNQNTTANAATATIASTVTTNANMTGDVTSNGNITSLVGTANVESVIRTNTLNQLGAPTAALPMANQRISALGTPQVTTDAAQAIGSQLGITVFAPTTTYSKSISTNTLTGVEATLTGTASSGTLTQTPSTLTMLVSTTSFPSIGRLILTHNATTYIVSYTGIAGSTFTGCTIPTGSIAVSSGDSVNAANLTLIHTAISTQTLVEVDAFVFYFGTPTPNASVAFALFTHATTTQQGGTCVAFSAQAATANSGGRAVSKFLVTGLSPGSTYYWDLAWATSSNTAVIVANSVQASSFSSGTAGQITMRATAQ